MFRDLEPSPTEDEPSCGERSPSVEAFCFGDAAAGFDRNAARSSAGLLGASAASSMLFHVLLVAAAWRSWGPYSGPKAVRRPQIVIESGVTSVESQRSIAGMIAELITTEAPQREQPDSELQAPPVQVRRRAEALPPPTPPSPEPVVSASRSAIVSAYSIRLPSESETSLPATLAEPPRRPKKTDDRAAPPAAESVASVKSTGSRVEVPPKSLPTNPNPAYPADAWAKRIEGLVELRVLVGVDGRAREVVIHQSSGSDALDQAALQTVRDQWRFEPARDGTNPVELTVIVPIRFQIRMQN